MSHLNSRSVWSAALRAIRVAAAAFFPLLLLAPTLKAGPTTAPSTGPANPPDPRGEWSVSLVRDINGRTTYGGITEPIDLRGNLLFVARTTDLGAELWKSDGTALGTAPLMDIFPGPGDSAPSGLTAFKGAVYFAADDGSAGRELWRTDGTTDGTRRVKDVLAGPGSSSPAHLTVVGDLLYFTCTDADGLALYKTDGTDAGTLRVKRLQAGPYYYPNLLFAAVKNTLFFTTWTPAEGYELWKSDGTEAGTALVKDLNPGPQAGVPDHPVVIGDTLFFTAEDAEHGQQVWKTDGTADGTVIVKQTCTGCHGASTNNGIFDLVPLGNRVVFRVATFQPSAAVQIWATDGTDAGTEQLLEIPGMYSTDRREFARLGNQLIFETIVSVPRLNVPPADPRYEPPGTPCLWVTDGTPKGTHKFKSGAGYNAQAVLGNAVYFSGAVGDVQTIAATGRELCRTDGTDLGTFLVKDLRPARGESSSPESLTVAGKLLYFCADDGSGLALWRTDGTPSETLRLAQFPAGTGNSDPAGLTAIAAKPPGNANAGKAGAGKAGAGKADAKDADEGNRPAASASSVPSVAPGGKLFFLANGDPRDPYHPSGPQVWASDGTAAGTRQLTEFPPGVYLGHGGTIWPTTPFTPVDGTAFFSVEPNFPRGPVRAGGAPAGRPDASGLWVSDGTPAGTRRIRSNLTVHDRVAFKGKLYFAGYEYDEQGKDVGGGVELWQSDGTTERTRRLVKLANIPGGSSPRSLTVLGDKLYFSARFDAPLTHWLYVTDGTADGTTRLQKVDVMASAPFGKGLMLAAPGDGPNTLELWTTDGTADGTKRFKAFNGRAVFRQMLAVGKLVYFSVYTPEYGVELWKTDGTHAGTALVKDIAPGPEGSMVSWMTAYRDRLYFTALQTGHPSDLWTSDGTEAGTVPVLKTWPPASVPGAADPRSPRPGVAYLTSAAGLLFFAAGAGNDFEPWVSDGTEAGTRRLADLRPGPAGSQPREFCEMDGAVYFSAEDAAHGRELWKAEPTATTGRGE